MTNIGNHTRSVLVFFTVSTAMPALSFADYLGNSEHDILDAGGTFVKVAPHWRIVCFGEGGDAYGVATSRKHCRIEKGNFRAIAVITAKGLSIPYLPSRPACGGYSGKMKVDEKSIDKLPLKPKLVAMSRGTTFSRFYQTAWPECRRIIELTSLYRFSEALDRLKAEWKAFK